MECFLPQKEMLDFPVLATSGILGLETEWNFPLTHHSTLKPQMVLSDYCYQVVKKYCTRLE